MEHAAQSSSPTLEQRIDIHRPPRAQHPSSSELYEHDDKTDVLIPSLPEASPTEHPSIISRAIGLIWDSCIGCAVLGALFLSAAVVATKELSNDDASVFQAIFARGTLALPVLVPLGYYQTGFIIGPTDHNMKWIVLRGMCAALGLLFALVSYVLITLSEAALLIDTYPAMLAFMAWMFRIESIDLYSWIGIVGSIAANVLIARPPFLVGDEDSLVWDLERIGGLVCAFLSVLLMSTGFLLVGKIDRSIPSVVIANHSAVLVAFFAVPFLAIGYPEKIDWTPSLKHIGLYILTACGSVNQVFIVRAFQIGPPIKAAMASLSRVLMIVCCGIIFFSEEISVRLAVGGFLLICSIILVIYSRDRARVTKT